MKSLIPWSLALIWLALLAWAGAQGVMPKDPAEVERLVEQMGDDDFNVRQQASLALMARVNDNPDFANYLRRFANDEDPEIRSRIEALTKNLPEVLKWVDPARETELKSLRLPPVRLKLTVRNRSNFVIKNYWIDWEGNREPRRTIQPGEEVTYAVTYRDHPWLVTDENDTALGIYIPGSKDALIIFTGKEGK